MTQTNEKKTWIANLLSVIVLLGTFAICCLFLILIGIKVYKNVVVSNDDNFELRTSLTYVATKCRAASTAGQAWIEEIDGIPVLTLGEKYEGVAVKTLIYFRDGKLYEGFTRFDSSFDLENGMAMFDIENFTIEQTQDGMLQLTAQNSAGDSETLMLSLRTGLGRDR